MGSWTGKTEFWQEAITLVLIGFNGSAPFVIGLKVHCPICTLFMERGLGRDRQAA